MRFKNFLLICFVYAFFIEFASAEGARLIQKVENAGYIYLGVHATDGSYVTAAFFEGNDFLIRKTNASGKNIWVRHLQISGPEFTNDTYTNVNAMIETADQGFVVIGETQCETCSELLSFIIKVNKNGNLKWKKGYKNSTTNKFTFRSLSSTPDGGFILAAETGKEKSLIRFSPVGEIVWKKGFALDSFLSSSVSTQDNGIALFYNDQDAVLILKFDDSGNLNWKRRLKIPGFNNPFYGSAKGVPAVDGFVLAGNLQSNLFVIRLNANGSMRWKKAFSTGSKDVYVENIRQTKDQGFIVNTIIRDAALFFKITRSGKIVFQNQINELQGRFVLLRSTFEAPKGGYVSFGSFAYDDGVDGLIPEDDQVFLKWDSIGIPASCVSAQPGNLKPMPFGPVKIVAGPSLGSSNPITLQARDFELKSVTSTIRKSNICKN